MSGQFLIVGLGNPGPKYAKTRHNAGFWFLAELARASGASFRSQSRLQADTAGVNLEGHDCILVRPGTFMNNSGRVVRAVSDYYRVPVQRLLIAYDELDLPPGTAKLKQGGGHGGHNGMRDIFRHMDDRDFLRLRIGIGHPGFKDAVTAYVLSRASAGQEKLILNSIANAVEVMPDILDGNVAGAMTRLHTAEAPPPECP